MKFTCLSKGGGFNFPPCNILTFSGFKILFDCPLDFSSLAVFSPVPVGFDVILDQEPSHSPNHGSQKRQKIEKPLDRSCLINGEPWYKTVSNLHLQMPSRIDVVLISSPMGMLGLPFLTRAKCFSAKIYVTEATAKIGKLMMDDLVSMHMEFKQFYGSEDDGFPQWMRQEELELLHCALREVAFGKGEAELGGWMPMYSAVDVNDCMQKVQTLRYGEESCYNGAVLVKAFSSGLEIGTCNWTINGPKRNIAYITSSIFFSSTAMNFDYFALQEKETIIYSDFLSFEFMNGVENDTRLLSDNLLPLSDEETMANLLSDPAESTEEMEKLSFICACAIQSVESGGSVLIPINRLSITLQLIEHISASLEYSNLKVPIYLISSVAEELLAFTNVIPEWLCKQRQEKLFSGEPLFAFIKLLEEKKLYVFPALHSPKLITNWKEPCIVFCPHWSLRLGPVVHLLRHWCGNPSSLLLLEKGIDAEIALLPFRPIAMKVLQCSFLSGIKLKNVEPLLKVLKPKVALLPEKLSQQINTTPSFMVLPYAEGETLRVPSLKDSVEIDIATDLATKFCWRKLHQENINITRLKGELSLNCGKFMLQSGNEEITSDQRERHWGQPNLERLLNSLSNMGIKGSVEEGTSKNACVIRINDPKEAVIEIQESRSIICAADKTLSAHIFDALDSILDGI